MSEVFLVEDDKFTSEAVMRFLNGHGYKVSHRGNGEKAWQLIELRKLDIDLIILDIGLPGMNGIQLCQKIRQNNIYIPIIFLTSDTNQLDVIKALDLGADDYVTKPFSFQILLSRIRANLRRPATFVSRSVQIGTLEIDLDNSNVKLKSDPITLRRKEFDVLKLLVINRNRTISRDFILDNIWQDSHNLNSNTVDVCIKGLRKKLATELPHLIQTVHGFGYRLNAGD